MKKFVTLFTDSFRELKAVRTITTMAMLAAVAVILGFFSIEYGQFIRIGFSSIPNGIIDYLFEWWLEEFSMVRWILSSI